MKTPYVLALDLGTTGNRAIVFDRTQKPVFRAYEEFPQFFPKPGWVEHDAEAIWRSARRVLQRVFDRYPVSKMAALGLTNQRETVVLWDRATGKPIHRAIVWQDRRTAAACEALKAKALEKKIRAKTGLFLDPYFSATKLAWLLDNVKGARRRAEKGELLAGTIDTWIAWKLSAGALHVTDASNASRTLLYDIRSLSWDPWLCGVFGVPEAILPRVVPTSGFAGAVDKDLFRGELPIASLVGDQQAASFAQGCFGPGIVKNTYGTGLFLVENTGRTPRFSKDLLTTVAWSEGTPRGTEYAVEGSVFVGGAAVQWLRDGLGIIEASRDVEPLARSVASNDGVYFVPALSGLGAPYWDPNARGLLIGLTRGTTRAHVARAALEAIAYQTRDVMEAMRRDTGHRFKRLRVDGGAAADDFLMQFQADVLGIPVERPKVLDTTALGAAGLAGLAAGFWKSRAEFDRGRRVERTFKPRAGRGADALYARWKRAVERSRGWALALALLALFSASPASAEKVVLKGGHIRDGKVVERTKDYVVVDVSGIRTPYYYEEIESIDGAPPRETPRTASAPAPSPDIPAEKLSAAPPPGDALENDPRKLAAVSLQLFNEKRFLEAIRVDERALTMPLDNGLRAHFALNASSSHLELGVPEWALARDDAHYKKSIEYARMCLDADPVAWQALGNIATVHMNMGRLEEAEAAYAEAQGLADPESPYYRQLVRQRAMVRGALEASRRIDQEGTS